MVAYLIGKLDNSPQFRTLLKADDEIHFYPKHIVKIWDGSKTLS